MNKRKIIFFLFVSLVGIAVLLVTLKNEVQQVPSVEQDIDKLKAIHVVLTKGNPRTEEMIKRWLRNPDTGYPDLVKVLLEVVKCPAGGCNVKGPYLPLDVIEGHCREMRGDPVKVILNHKPEEVIKAYIEEWYEQNPNEDRDLTLEQILRGD